MTVPALDPFQKTYNTLIMKSFHLTALLVFSLVFGLQAQATMTLNQTFSAKSATHIDFAVPSHQVAVKTTKGSRIIVESKVKLSTPNERLLKFLVDTKRYELQHAHNTQKQLLTIKRPKVKGAVMVKGEEIQETVYYTLYLPEETAFVTKTTSYKVEG